MTAPRYEVREQTPLLDHLRMGKPLRYGVFDTFTQSFVENLRGGYDSAADATESARRNNTAYAKTFHATRD